MSDKPTVGRIVHFYDSSLSTIANNGTGHGPYAAVITQVFDGAKYANLKVLPYGNPWDEGSVSHQDDAPECPRYWVWPPRV